MCILACLLVCIKLLCLHCSYRESCISTLPAGICSPAPNAPANGQRSGSGLTFGSTVTYTCNPGYTLQGESRGTCMANGHWSGRAPTCNRKLLCKHMFHYRHIWTLIATKVHQYNDVAVWWQLGISLYSRLYKNWANKQQVRQRQYSYTTVDIDIKVYNYALCAVYVYCDLFILFPWPLMLV